MIESVLKSFWLHPFRWLLAVSFVFLSFFVICSGTQEKETPLKENVSETGVAEKDPPSSLPPANTAPEAENPSSSGPGQSGEDPAARSNDPIQADETEAEVIQAEKISAERAALPFLPLKTPSVEAEYINQLETGDLLIEVRYRGTKKEAIATWQRFLDKYQDPGTAYLVVYEPK